MPSLPIGALNGEQIKSLDMIEHSNDQSYRAASYDFQIGQIVTPDGELRTSYKLPPQGIVEVISKEKVSMPNNIVGNVQIKTGFSNIGLLALGIGIIDPGYHGKVSSFIVNFSKDERILSRNQTFLRTIFFKTNNTDLASENSINSQAYLSDARNRVVSGFSKTFLNTDKVVEEFLEEATGKYKRQFITYVSIAAFGLALMTFLLNFGSFAVMQRWFDPRIQVTGEAETSFGNTQSEIEGLKQRLSDLEKANGDTTSSSTDNKLRHPEEGE